MKHLTGLNGENVSKGGKRNLLGQILYLECFHCCGWKSEIHFFVPVKQTKNVVGKKVQREDELLLKFCMINSRLQDPEGKIEKLN